MTRLAIAGATGLVGRKMLETVDRKGIVFDELVLFSSARSAGEQIEFQGKTYTVRELTDEAASEPFDYVLMMRWRNKRTFSPIFEEAVLLLLIILVRMQSIDLIVQE